MALAKDMKVDLVVLGAAQLLQTVGADGKTNFSGKHGMPLDGGGSGLPRRRHFEFPFKFYYHLGIGAVEVGRPEESLIY